RAGSAHAPDTVCAANDTRTVVADTADTPVIVIAPAGPASVKSETATLAASIASLNVRSIEAIGATTVPFRDCEVTKGPGLRTVTFTLNASPGSPVIPLAF